MNRIFFPVFGLLSLSAPVWAVESPSQVPAQVQNDNVYSCPMHPDVHSHSSGECPICHMKLQKVQSSPVFKAVSRHESGKPEPKIKFYRNPMNPAVTSKVPMKDSMGMDYLPVYEEAQSGTVSTVEGRGVVRLDEGQFRLSGASRVKVVRKDLQVRYPVSGRVLSSGSVSIQVAERDLAHVRTGLMVELESPLAPGQILMGQITSLDSILDPMTRSLRALVKLKSQVAGLPLLRPEGSVSGSFKITRPQVLVVPVSSVLYTSQGPYLFVVKDSGQDSGAGPGKILTPKKVRLGLQAAEEVEVLEDRPGGIVADISVSGGPNFLLDSESRIRAAQGT